MRIPDIVNMKFGSHLYGLNSPSSDLDYKGIFMPSLNEILLGRIPKSESQSSGNDKSKNNKKDIDVEIYSLHYFIKLACEGQTVALDMLHAPNDMIITSSSLWESLVSKRHLFYTKNLQAFVGYARRQASKYGIKGSRLDAAKRVVEFLGKQNPVDKLVSVWTELPLGEHIFKHDKSIHSGLREYEVCGRKVQETASIQYTRDVFNKFYKSYGERAKLAASNSGIDWKAVSHAMRAAFQVKEILEDRTITFPLKEREYLKKVKYGKLDYLTEVAPRLESVMDEVEMLSEVSELPSRTDRVYWDMFIVKEVKSVIGI